MSTPANRRDFLSGRALLGQVAAAGQQWADTLIHRPSPGRGPALMLRTTAMATDFDILLNPDGPPQQLEAASAALDDVARLEQQYSVYREESELSRLNATAHQQPCTLEPRLFALLEQAVELHRQTNGAFHPAVGKLIQLWRTARKSEHLPTSSAIAEAVSAASMEHVLLDQATCSVRFSAAGPMFDLGAIGKGYAVDRAAEILTAANVEHWLIHGGKSSALVRGGHAGHDGWPVALQNPLLPDRPWATLLLKDAALSTSGTAVQWFRHEGRRYGHILDPRTGWPVDAMLSVSVIAPRAALSDALSTAFFVLGVENALACCDNFPEVGVILFPYPEDGRTLRPILRGVAADRWYPAESA